MRFTSELQVDHVHSEGAIANPAEIFLRYEIVRVQLTSKFTFINKLWLNHSTNVL